MNVLDMEKSIYVICLIFVLRNVSSQSNNRCTTPDQLNGICINIKRCTLIESMFSVTIKNQTTRNFISKSFCGYEGNDPKVCCPLTSDYVTVSSPKLPNQKICGNSTVTKSKIVGGSQSELGAWPWIAAIGYKHNLIPKTNYEWLCGGSLISDIYVLTAAHCTTGQALRNRQIEVVRLGDLDLDPTKNDEAKPIDYGVIRIIRHEGYNSSKYTNDIALLKLNASVTFTDLIQPICMPVMSKMRENMLVKYQPYVAGWGAVEFRQSSGTILREVQVIVKDNTECKQLYSEQPNIVDERVLCAGDNGKDSCQGDSGGPLMWPSRTRYYLVGIVSFGVGCADQAYPGVYTRVSAFMEWIVNNMNDS